MSHAVPTWDLRLSHAPELLCVAVAASRYGSDGSSDHDRAHGWCLSFYKHEATLSLGGRKFEIAPGSVGIVPPGVAHEYHCQGSFEHLYAQFKLRAPTGDAMPIAALQDLGSEFTPLYERFEHAMNVFHSRPAQAEACVWDLLWELSECTTRRQQRQTAPHSAFERACQVIQTRISEPLSMADLAASGGVAAAHLTRLFRAEMGLTAMDYLRRCRLERALHLLTRSDLPIREVASEIGVRDLQAFNKIIRRGYSLSPRQLRARGTAPNGLTLRTSTKGPAPLLIQSKVAAIRSA